VNGHAGRARPLTWMLHAGILLRPVKPPATPSSFVATRVPTTALRFGAISVMRDSTYCRICEGGSALAEE
jgi:hypothetical protein